MLKVWLCQALCLMLAVGGCKGERGTQVAGKIWSEIELRTLQGKSRDEIRDMLGKPDGFYTTDAKGRWHYSNIWVGSEGAGPPKHVWLLIYFSRQGEERATLVDILDRPEEGQSP